jgi:hypothetical protein
MTMTMTERTIRWAITLVAIAASLSSASALAQSQTSVAGAGAGVFPGGASFNGVSLSALSFGMGAVILTNDGTATGTFESTLIGTSLLGRINIVVVGNLTRGSGQAGGPATYSGLCSIDLGNGTPLLRGLPFTVTVARLPNTQWGLTLILGLTLLPAATVNTGSVTIQ